MKIKATKHDLDAAIQIASIGVASGDADSDIRTHLLFRWLNGKLYVLANNGMRILAGAVVLGAEVTGAADGDSFSAPSWRVRKFVSAVKKEDDVLTLDYADGLTKATCKRGVGKWGSLNPKDFPLWDKTLADAKVVAKVPIQQLAEILGYNRHFVSDMENKQPQLAATECIGGVFYATDSVGVSLVTSPAFAKSNMRVHGKDISSIITFLSIKGPEEIEVVEHDLCLFLRRPDDVEGIIGVSRWAQAFPAMKIDKNEADKCWFTVEAEQVKEAMDFLVAFAQKDDIQLRFRFDKPGEVTLSMTSSAGSGEDDQPIPFIESEGMEKLAEAGYTGFALSKKFVEIVAGTRLTEKTVKFGINWVKKNGYVTFRYTKDGSDYFTLIVWLRK